MSPSAWWNVVHDLQKVLDVGICRVSLIILKIRKSISSPQSSNLVMDCLTDFATFVFGKIYPSGVARNF